MPAVRVPTLLLLAVLVVRRCALAPLSLAIDDRGNVKHAHDRCNNRVCNHAAALRAGQLQAKSAIHHSKNDRDTTDADVRVRHGRAATVLLEISVVEHSSERLCEEDDEKHNADDRVCASEVLAIHSDPNTNTEGHDVDEEADDLQSSVHPDQAGEARGSDENAANGEESNESERSHDAVGEDHGFARAAESAVAAVLGELRVA